jgi:peroxiredoxin
MRSLVLPAALALALAAARPASALGPSGPPPEPRATSPWSLTGVEPGPSYVCPGDVAPDVSWESPSGWRRLRDLRTQGNVLLVFGADDRQLVQLERERPALLALGVVPAAVVERRAGACQALARRLQLGYPVLPDPQRVIATQYNCLDAITRRAVPAWFAVDRGGAVRDAERGTLPARSWAAAAANALNLPAPGVSLPTGAPR